MYTKHLGQHLHTEKKLIVTIITVLKTEKSYSNLFNFGYLSTCQIYFARGTKFVFIIPVSIATVCLIFETFSHLSYSMFTAILHIPENKANSLSNGFIVLSSNNGSAIHSSIHLTSLRCYILI